MGAKAINQALNLRQWFYRNARLPILVSILAMVAVEVLLLAVIGKHQLELQQGVANRLAEFSRLALIQESTALLQAGFDIAIRDLRASRALVCEAGWILVLKNPEPSPCFIEPVFGYRILRVPFGGNFQFALQVPIFPQESLIYYTLGLSVGVCILGMFLLRRVGFRLERDLFQPLFKNLSSQLQLPIRELELLRQRLIQLNQLRTQEAVASAVVARNVQVAHDIRSPLTALLFASKDFDLLPNSSRKVIQTAVNRISSIVDSLSEPKKTETAEGKAKLKETLLEIYLEKKIEYQNLTKLIWEENISELSPSKTVPLESHVLKRVLSNLINNSVEAMPLGEGMIELGACEAGAEIQIWVKDTGKGFPSDLIRCIGKPGLTIGKPGGQGLGLSHAIEVVKAARGTLEIDSQSGFGTKVRLCFIV